MGEQDGIYSISGFVCAPTDCKSCPPEACCLAAVDARHKALQCRLDLAPGQRVSTAS